VLDMGLTIGCW